MVPPNTFKLKVFQVMPCSMTLLILIQCYYNIILILYTTYNNICLIYFDHVIIIIDCPIIVPLQLLKSLLVHREKCTVEMALTHQQWCAVLSGLRGAKKLKELVVFMCSKVCLVT